MPVIEMDKLAEVIERKWRLRNADLLEPTLNDDMLDDPTGGQPGMPPNHAQWMLPHVSTFVGMVNGATRVYRDSDEAMMQSYANARFMRNDISVMECVEMRQRATALLDWHLEPEDAKSPAQKELCARLTKILKRIPYFTQYRENLLHATFYGKYAVQQRWRWRSIEGRMQLCVCDWLPLHGDKIVYRFFDKSQQFRPDQVGIRIGGNQNAMLTSDKRTKVGPTDRGLAYWLDSWERPLLAIHRHQVEDGEYEAPWHAGRIHGHGIRSRVYWTWFQKQETLAFLMEYLERAAAGFELWYYPMGNDAAKREIRAAATERSEAGRNVVIVPRPVGNEGAYYDVQRIEPGMAGIAEMKALVQEYFGHAIKRYILGQTLTTEAEATGLGSGVADVHLETFMQIIRYDATILEESITTDLVHHVKQFNFPEATDIDVRFKIDTEQPDSEAKMAAFVQAYGLGLKLRAQDVRDILGAAAPEEDDEVLSAIEQQKQMQALQPQQPPEQEPGGMPLQMTAAPQEVNGARAARAPAVEFGDIEHEVRQLDRV